MKKISRMLYGNVKMFVIINTTNYNKDGKYGVTICNFAELFELGFDERKDKQKLDEMEVEDLMLTDVGSYVIRIA